MTIERQVASDAAGDYLLASERWVRSADEFMGAELRWFERAWSQGPGSPDYQQAEWESHAVLYSIKELEETRDALLRSHENAVNALDRLKEPGDMEFVSAWRTAVRTQKQHEERAAQVLPSGWQVGESGRRRAEEMRNYLGRPAPAPADAAAQAAFDAKYGTILGVLGATILLGLFVALPLFWVWSQFQP